MHTHACIIYMHGHLHINDFVHKLEVKNIIQIQKKCLERHNGKLHKMITTGAFLQLLGRNAHSTLKESSKASYNSHKACIKRRTQEGTRQRKSDHV